MEKIIKVCILILLGSAIMAQGSTAAFETEGTVVSITSTPATIGTVLSGTTSNSEEITVNLNLSEIDDTKLPVQYEHKVIMEAPIVGLDWGKKITYKDKIIMNHTDDKGTYFVFNGKNRTPSGTFLLGGSINIQIAKDGIYALDQYNARIQKFNKDGVHIKDIYFKDPYKLGGKSVLFNKSDYRVTDDGQIYLYESVNRTVEMLNDDGLVSRVVDLKTDRDELAIQLNEGFCKNGFENKRFKMLFDRYSSNPLKKNFEATFSTYGAKNVMYKIHIKTNEEIFNISQHSINGSNTNYDKFDYMYLYVSINNSIVLNGFYVIDSQGELVGHVKTYAAYWGKEWKDSCGLVPEKINDSGTIDDEGNIYLIQRLCSKILSEDVMGKIRIVKFTKTLK